MPNADAAQIKRNGWRQGSVLSTALVERLKLDEQIPNLTLPMSNRRVAHRGPAFVRRCLAATRYYFGRKSVSKRGTKQEMWMVVSHDCDVTNGNLEAEPNVEIICLEHVEDQDGHLFWAKNPRRYQFVDGATGDSQVYQLGVHEKVSIDRVYLIDSSPDGDRTIDDENVRRVCSWLARRYIRSAFPDEFNERTRRATIKLKKPLKKSGDALTGVYLLVVDDELLSEEDYRITLSATMRDDEFDNPRVRQKAQELVNKLESELNSCDGIDVLESELLPERDVSLSDLRLLKRWDFDDLSLRAESVSELPPTP